MNGIQEASGSSPLISTILKFQAFQFWKAFFSCHFLVHPEIDEFLTIPGKQMGKGKLGIKTIVTRAFIFLKVGN